MPKNAPIPRHLLPRAEDIRFRTERERAEASGLVLPDKSEIEKYAEAKAAVEEQKKRKILRGTFDFMRGLRGGRVGSRKGGGHKSYINRGAGVTKPTVDRAHGKRAPEIERRRKREKARRATHRTQRARRS
jgi:hypothetical protein